jgi:uroporphyrinogen-III decarboxylase
VSHREYFLELAASGLRFPIGTDLILQEQPDPEAILLDGRRLGEVVRLAAERYRCPLAIPLMDLRLEKADLLRSAGVETEDVDKFHFAEAPPVRKVDDAEPFAHRNQANIDAVAHIARETSLFPVGMAIGPFSLMTKLLADPITAVALAAGGATANDDPGVRLVETCLELAEAAVARSLRAQVRAGAKAVIVCEPAANRVYISPRALRAGSDVWERYVMEPNLRLKGVLEGAGADLIFHDCGELIPFMVEQFATRLHPVVLSLGSSRKLWEDAELVPKDVVMFGNLPTKNFYSDEVVPEKRVAQLTEELLAHMHAVGHPHILGSECDVLHVPDRAASIRRKVDVMLSANR